MVKRIKKGFTLVELLVVIAILAILGTVSIVGYTSFTKKANYSNDTTLVNEWNRSLEGKGVLAEADIDEKLDTVIEVKEFFIENGTDNNSFTPKSNDYHFYWCEMDNYVYLVDDASGFTVKYPESTTVTLANSYRLDLEYYSVTCSIEGITLDKKIVAKDATNIEITLTATDVDMPKKVKIGDTEYAVSNKKITVASITSNIVINEVIAPASDYLTFTSEQANSTIKFKPYSGTWQYSTDKSNWTDGTSDTTITLTNIGDKVYLKGSNCKTTYKDYGTDKGYYNFAMTGTITASGDVTSLINNDIGGDVTLTTNYCFSYMFANCISLTNAPNLPSTTLSDGCYSVMFKGCTSLTQAPVLNAMTMTQSCYSNMFQNCTSLTQAPALPATTLNSGCYMDMFNGCTSLTQAPALPATTASFQCYIRMFKGCTSFIKAPEIKTAITSSSQAQAFVSMFEGCTNLKIATTGDNAHKIFTCNKNSDYVTDMFKNCKSGEGLFTGTPANGTAYYWCD